MYVAGETVTDKNEADDVFRNNLLRLVSAAGGPWWLRWLRRRRVMVYFAAVRHFGGPWFWNGKNPIDHKYTTALLISRTWYLNWDSLLLSWIKRLFTSR